MTELKALSDAAIGGEWSAAPWGDGSSSPGFVNIHSSDKELVFIHDVMSAEAAFIVALANKFRAGELVEREKVDGLREALEMLALGWESACPHLLPDTADGLRNCADDLRAALAELENPDV